MPIELQPFNKTLRQCAYNLPIKFRANLPTEYDPITSIILPPKQPRCWHHTATERTRARADMHASYNSLTLPPY